MDLQSRINVALVMSGEDRRYFLPETKFGKLMEESEIRSEVGDEPVLVDFIVQGAKRIFALVVSLGITRDAEELRSVMENFRLSNFDDSRLPVMVSIGLGITEHSDSNGSDEERRCKAVGHTHCDHHDLPYLDAFHHKLWNAGKIKRFYTDQWQFRAPVFSSGKLKHKLFPDDVLPFTKVFDNPRDGSFSKVSRVRIHEDHQQVLNKVSLQYSIE